MRLSSCGVCLVWEAPDIISFRVSVVAANEIVDLEDIPTSTSISQLEMEME